jgi:hypothetical protein
MEKTPAVYDAKIKENRNDWSVAAIFGSATL